CAWSQRLPCDHFNEIGKENAVARSYFGSDGVGRMPGIVPYRESVTAVRREWHSRSFRFRSVRQSLVKNRADISVRIVSGQIKLHRNSFPKTVGVFENAIARNVASQNRDRIHSDPVEILPETFFQTRSEFL